MERTQLYLEKVFKEKLQALAKESGRTMAELVREAVEQYLAVNHDPPLVKLKEAEGIWKDRNDIPDSVSYVDELRKKWSNQSED